VKQKILMKTIKARVLTPALAIVRMLLSLSSAQPQTDNWTTIAGRPGMLAAPMALIAARGTGQIWVTP
jgi:hypothetical protein